MTDRLRPTICASRRLAMHARDRTFLTATSLLSFAGAIAIGLSLSSRRQVDIDVYLMGARHLFGSDLYRAGLPGVGLGFTYSPFAALLFAPLGWLPESDAQHLWAVLNILALGGLLYVSLRAVRPSISSRDALRFAGFLTLPTEHFLNPIGLTISFGQVNLFLAWAILGDLAGTLRFGTRGLPRGVLTGIAAAVKLTPLIFVPYLLLTNQVRAMWRAIAAFCICSLATGALAPRASWQFWSKFVFDSSRAGSAYYISDQNLKAVLIRFHHGEIPGVPLLAGTLIFGVVGLALANFAHRSSSPMLGVLLCATTGLIVSPITWAHHLVWICPVLMWLVLADDRPRAGRLIACGSAALFAAAPIWWVPRGSNRELAENGWQLLCGNSFFFAMIGFMFGSLAMLAYRAQRTTQIRITVPPESAANLDSRVGWTVRGSNSGTSS